MGSGAGKAGLISRAAEVITGVAGTAVAKARTQGGRNPPKACGKIHLTAGMNCLSLKNIKRNGVEPCGLAPFLCVWRKNSVFEGIYEGKFNVLKKYTKI